MAYCNELYHHGVKGQRWGVRKTKYYSRKRRKANNIYKTLTDKEKYYVTAEKKPPKVYATRKDYSRKGYNVFSLIEQYGRTPVSVLDLWDQGDGSVSASIAVRNDPRFRGKGHARKAVEAGKQWLEEHPEYYSITWGVAASNTASKSLAEKSGFTYTTSQKDFDDPDNKNDNNWDYYVYKNPNYKMKK